MGGLSPHGAHAHVFINGIYWGIHTLHERPDDNFAASYFGEKMKNTTSLSIALQLSCRGPTDPTSP